MNLEKYRSLFVEEATEHLAEMSRALLVLEKESTAEETAASVDCMFRVAHSIKGMAASLDYDSVSSLAHRLEDWLEHHGVALDPTLVLDDRNQALPIPEVRNTPFGQIRSFALAPYPYLVQVRSDGFLSPEITASLRTQLPAAGRA